MSPGWLAVVAIWLAAYELGRYRFPRVAARRWPSWRHACAAGSALAAVGAWSLAPLGLDHRLLWVETLQFCLLAFATAPLAALSAPGALARGQRPGFATGVRRPAVTRRRLRPLGALAAFLAVTVAWRLPVAVDALVAHHDLVALEAVSLVAGTAPFWEAIATAPGRQLAVSRPARLALAAAGVWSVWAFAWAVGFSGHAFYPAFRRGANPVSAQEWGVCILWLTSALAVGPHVFGNLVRWLAADRLVADAEATLYLHRRAADDGFGPDQPGPALPPSRLDRPAVPGLLDPHRDRHRHRRREPPWTS